MNIAKKNLPKDWLEDWLPDKKNKKSTNTDTDVNGVLKKCKAANEEKFLKYSNTNFFNPSVHIENPVISFCVEKSELFNSLFKTYMEDFYEQEALKKIAVEEDAHQKKIESIKTEYNRKTGKILNYGKSNIQHSENIRLNGIRSLEVEAVEPIEGTKQNSKKLPTALPELGKYEKWADRTTKNEMPLAFLDRVWGDYIRAGLLYQADLRGNTSKKNPKNGLDKTLFDRVSAQCVKQGEKLESYLPNKKVEVSKRIELFKSALIDGLKKEKQTGYYKQKPI